MSSQLPVELYRHIFSHVPRRKDICSISLVSHAFFYESAPFLWGALTLNEYDVKLLSHLPATPRITQHIHSLYIEIRKPEIADLLRPILQATSNLKSLQLDLDARTAQDFPDINLGHFTQGITFKLHRLASNLPVTLSCREFIRGQLQLVDLEWTLLGGIPTGFFSPTDLPSLTTLSAESGITFETYPILSAGQDRIVDALLPGRNITHLKCAHAYAAFKEPFESVQVLEVVFSAGVMADIPRIFPNLRAMSFRFVKKNDIMDVVKGLQHLTIVALSSGELDTYQSCAQFATQLFDSNPKLERVEIAHLQKRLVKRWKLGRGCDLNVPSSPPLGLKMPKDEWKKW